ncbi:amidohydrolase family protein [Streptomyces sp. G44]|uniref:amidohydrolase family protein n=1 Tax=Streptomyces sp. G44 TaxID=2807632 RepID=UPI0027DC838A|nr:amidohydrolase family protein [Streptomyces sp. G44]
MVRGRPPPSRSPSCPDPPRTHTPTSCSPRSRRWSRGGRGSPRRERWTPAATAPPRLRELVRVAGAGRVPLGSDAPFDTGTDDPVGVPRSARPAHADFHSVRGGNAVALLRKD